MTRRQKPTFGRPRRREGFTLVEVLSSLVILSVLVVAMGSAIMIAGRAVESEGTSAAVTVDAAEAVDRITADLHFALAFTERTATAVAFTVPDRDGNMVPETIRYAWSGTPGEPLTREFNGSDPVVLADDVQSLDFSYLYRTMAGTGVGAGGNGGGGGALMFVVADAGGPSAQDSLKRALMESWGYKVAMISASASQAELDSMAASANVIYVSEEIDQVQLGTKLRDSTTGIVSEDYQLADELGLASAGNLGINNPTFVTDNTHYITSGLSSGSATLFSADQPMIALAGTLASGLAVEGTWSGYLDGRPALSLLETGANLYGGGTAAARRVVLPWSGYGTMYNSDISMLSADGRTIMQRSLDWAAGGTGGGNTIESEEILLIAHDDAPGGEMVGFDVNNKRRAAQFFQPTLPAEAISWKVTRALLRLKSSGAADCDLLVGMTTASGQRPTTTVLETLTIPESTLGGAFQWVDLSFSQVMGIEPSKGLCLVVNGDHNAKIPATVEYESGGSPMTGDAHWLSSTNSGGSWSAPNETEDMRIYVYGTVTTMTE